MLSRLLVSICKEACSGVAIRGSLVLFPAFAVAEYAPPPFLMISNPKDGESGEVVQEAVAHLSPSVAGGTVQGTVRFALELDDHGARKGVRITADVSGLTPNHEHGFHIHEKGDCSNDAATAGGHYNPLNFLHGGPTSSTRHMGDLGNLKADEQGIAHYEALDTVIFLNGEMSIVGRSVVVHADPDDFRSQPAGNSGARVACGKIEATKRETLPESAPKKSPAKAAPKVVPAGKATTPAKSKPEGKTSSSQQ